MYTRAKLLAKMHEICPRKEKTERERKWEFGVPTIGVKFRKGPFSDQPSGVVQQLPLPPPSGKCSSHHSSSTEMWSWHPEKELREGCSRPEPGSPPTLPR